MTVSAWALLAVTFRFAMDFGDQRAGGVDIEQIAPASLFGHRFRHAVSREHDGPVARHLIEFVDEDRALGFQAFDDEPVMYDLMPHIDRPSIALDGALDDLDGTIHPGAKAARAGEQDREGLFDHGHKGTAGHRDPLACGPAGHCLVSGSNGIGRHRNKAAAARKAT